MFKFQCLKLDPVSDSLKAKSSPLAKRSAQSEEEETAKLTNCLTFFQARLQVAKVEHSELMYLEKLTHDSC